MVEENKYFVMHEIRKKRDKNRAYNTIPYVKEHGYISREKYRNSPKYKLLIERNKLSGSYKKNLAETNRIEREKTSTFNKLSKDDKLEAMLGFMKELEEDESLITVQKQIVLKNFKNRTEHYGVKDALTFMY